MADSANLVLDVLRCVRVGDLAGAQRNVQELAGLAQDGGGLDLSSLDQEQTRHALGVTAAPPAPAPDDQNDPPVEATTGDASGLDQAPPPDQALPPDQPPPPDQAPAA